ncbi:hypothetical protein V6Z11_A11G337000 [Gossypium hirsutum]
MTKMQKAFKGEHPIPFSPFWLGFLNPFLPPSSWFFEATEASTVNGGQGHQDPGKWGKWRCCHGSWWQRLGAALRSWG